MRTYNSHVRDTTKQNACDVCMLRTKYSLVDYCHCSSVPEHSVSRLILYLHHAVRDSRQRNRERMMQYDIPSHEGVPDADDFDQDLWNGGYAILY